MTNEESVLGWLRIAVSLGEVRFNMGNRPGGSGGDKSDIKGTSKDESRLGATLHQNTCGHGYRPEPCHPWNGRYSQDRQGSREHDNHNSTSLMGASPSECQRRWLGKDRYHTFSNK